MSTPQFRFSEVIARRFTQVLYRCLEEVRSTKGVMYLVIQGEPGLHLVSHYGFPRLSPPLDYLAPDSPLVAWVQRERRTFVVNDAQSYPELDAFTQGAETPRFLITPVYDRGNWLGILVQRDPVRGELYDLTQHEAPTLAICAEIVEAYREFRFILDPSSSPEPLQEGAGPMEAVPLAVPPSDSMFPPATPRYFPSPGEALEGYPTSGMEGEPGSLVTRSGVYATRALEEVLQAALPAPPIEGPPTLRPDLKAGMFLPEQRTFFWEAAALLSSLVPLAAVALWVDDPHELRPLLAYSPHPLSSELKQQILAHALYHLPKVVEADLQILIKSEWMEEEPQQGVFQTYLPIMLMDEGGGQDLLLLFRSDDQAFSEQEQVRIRQMARLLGFHFQEGRLHEQYHRAFLSVAHRILTSMEGGAPKLRAHSLNTARLVRNLALHLELSSSEVEAVSIAAILHDVGTFMIDPGLLAKSPLTAEEMAKMQAHPVLASIFLKDFRFPFDVLRIIRHHHERWDGMGYPDGLRGEEIPIESRLISLVETFEVMSSGSEFKAPVDRLEVLDELRLEAGHQFDPALVAGFIEYLASKPHRNP